MKRLPKRGAYDRETVFKILDEAFVCHVGFVVEGQPYVIPTNYGRVGETLYLHGSAASRMLRTLSEGIPVCVTATLIDGLVLARSAFHHSVNYRSVVILGTANADTIREWAVSYSDAVRPHTLGTGYVNFQMQEEGERVRAMYGDNYERLAKIKAAYDPDNAFRVNQNIRPAA